jgi:tetratricopeptide (TPR) repeat protein
MMDEFPWWQVEGRYVNTMRVAITRSVMFPIALALAVASMGAQGRPAAGDQARQVRTALAHGDLTGAKVIAQRGAETDAARVVALALVDMFEGRDADAYTRLLPLADRQPLGDAAVELGLLERRTGRIDDGFRRLDRIASNRQLNTPDDYYRLARAAVGTGEFLLANDAFQRIDNVPSAEFQTAWADMWLRRHRPGDAVISYQKALELDAEWVPAMIGMSRALADENPPASRELLQKALAQAPHHPDVHLALAEQQLEGEDVDAAEASLTTLATLRPGSVDEAALRAAVAYKRSGIAGAEAAVQAVQAINPRSSLGYRAAGEQAARQYRFDDAAALARKAVEIDPNDPFAQFNLGLYLMRTGDEAAARTALDTSWELDNSSPFTKNLLDVLDVVDGFEVVPHGPFIFKFAKEEAAVMRAYALPLADQAYELFSTRYGVKPDQPILVEVFPVHDDFAVRTLGLPGLVGALGACFGRVVTMDSPRARDPGDFSWQATLWHELAHVFTLHASDFRVPRWLTEGASVYEEHLRNPAWGRELTLEFARELGEGRTFGVKNLPQAFKRPESLAIAYFEASLLVEHLVAENGEAALRTLLQAYAEGADDAAAFTRAFGQSVDQADASFRAFVETRYGTLRDAMKVPSPRLNPDDLAALRTRAAAEPGNFAVQMTLGQALVRAEDFEGAIAPLERAAALAPMASGEASPRSLLAMIAEVQKDPERARRELRGLLEFDHTNVVAARRLADLAAQAKATDDEDRALALIAELDPFDAGVHVKLGRRLMAKGDHAAALVEFDAALAVGPANRAEARTDRAEALLALGRRDEARREVMGALQDAPTYARAQDILLETMGR